MPPDFYCKVGCENIFPKNTHLHSHFLGQPGLAIYPSSLFVFILNCAFFLCNQVHVFFSTVPPVFLEHSLSVFLPPLSHRLIQSVSSLRVPTPHVQTISAYLIHRHTDWVQSKQFCDLCTFLQIFSHSKLIYASDDVFFQFCLTLSHHAAHSLAMAR